MRVAATQTLRMNSYLHNIPCTNEARLTRKGVINIHISHFLAWDNHHAARERVLTTYIARKYTIFFPIITS
jgi:hypothetical protein